MIHHASIGLDAHSRSIKNTALVSEIGEIVRKSFAYDAVTTSHAYPTSMECLCRCPRETGRAT